MPWFDILAVAICFAAMAALIAVAVLSSLAARPGERFDCN
jgi:hypothetical protein